jgi:hypothetical protein
VGVKGVKGEGAQRLCIVPASHSRAGQEGREGKKRLEDRREKDNEGRVGRVGAGRSKNDKDHRGNRGRTASKAGGVVMGGRSVGWDGAVDTGGTDQRGGEPCKNGREKRGREMGAHVRKAASLGRREAKAK